MVERKGRERNGSLQGRKDGDVASDLPVHGLDRREEADAETGVQDQT